MFSGLWRNGPLELNWNQRFYEKKTTLKICDQVLTSPTHVQRHNTSFHCVVQRTITAVEYNKIEKCTCKACKNAVFHFQICKFVRFLLSSSSCLLKLPIIRQERVHLKSKQMSSFCGNAKVEE